MKKIPVVVTAGILSFFLSTILLFAEKQNIMVTPFVNRGEVKYNWISHGISDTVMADLNDTRGFTVLSEESRQAAMREMELGQTGILKDAVVVRIGEITGAHVVVSGHYKVSGEGITIYSKLVEVKSGRVKKDCTVEGDIKDIFSLQDRIVNTLLKGSAATQESSSKENYRPSFTAYEWYSRGLEARYRDPGKALSFFQKAVAIDGDYVDALLKAAYVSGRTLDRYREAEMYLQRAEKALKRKGQKKTLIYAYMLMVRGVVSDNSGDWEKAGRYYLAAKNLRDALKFTEDEGYAVLLINTGQNYEYRGDLDQALDHYTQARFILDDLDLAETSIYSTLLNDMGIVFHRKGAYDRALEFFTKSKILKEKLKLERSQKYSLTLNNIGNVYLEKNNLEKAFEYFQQARILRERLKLTGTKEYASILMNLGIIFSRRKEYNRALPLYNSADSIYSEIGNTRTKSYSMLLMNLGTTLRSLGKKKESMNYYMRSKKLKEELKLQNTSGYGHLLLNMGVLYYNTKDRKSACRYFKEAYNAYVRAKYHGQLKTTALRFSRECSP